MGWFRSRRNTEDDLPSRCLAYLEAGPPPQMTDYIQGSLTEIIIDHGAKSQSLDPELREIAGIILEESTNYHAYEDSAIKDYMQLGADLVKAVLERPD